MACIVKRRQIPCRLNFSAVMSCPSQLTSQGSATPRISSEKRATTENERLLSCSPKTIRPAADVLFGAADTLSGASTNFDMACFSSPSQVTKRTRRARQLSVSFSQCSKNFDGLRPSSRVLDTLVYCYFESHSITCSSDIQSLLERYFRGPLEHQDKTVFIDVHNQLTDLCNRASQLDPFASMPVLLRGGGRGLQLQSIHHPHLCRLKQLFEAYVQSVN